jgi:hypothetical protein
VRLWPRWRREKNPCPCRESNAGLSAHSLVIILLELLRFLFCACKQRNVHYHDISSLTIIFGEKGTCFQISYLFWHYSDSLKVCHNSWFIITTLGWSVTTVWAILDTPNSEGVCSTTVFRWLVATLRGPADHSQNGIYAHNRITTNSLRSWKTLKSRGLLVSDTVECCGRIPTFHEGHVASIFRVWRWRHGGNWFVTDFPQIYNPKFLLNSSWM